MGYKVAVVGATGAVGNEILNILAEREFPVDEVVALASGRSSGKEVSFGDERILKVRALETFDFEGTDIGLFSPGATVSKVHAPRAAAAGCVVIDNTSQFRMDEEVPLVVPEVNPDALDGFRERNIIANPNCSTIQMVMALKPLHDLAIIKRVVVATYQSVSGAGHEAMDELFEQTKGSTRRAPPSRQAFPKQIAFNVIPQIDVFLDDGVAKEEWKMAVETKKILDPAIEVAATCVRVPVFVGHSLAVNVEFEHAIEVEDARPPRRVRGRAGGRRPEDGEYMTPCRVRRRVRRLRLPPPQGPDRAARPRDVGGRRQPAQGRRPQRGPDRREAGRGGLPLNEEAAARPETETLRWGSLGARRQGRRAGLQQPAQDHDSWSERPADRCPGSELFWRLPLHHSAWTRTTMLTGVD